MTDMWPALSAAARAELDEARAVIDQPKLGKTDARKRVRAALRAAMQAGFSPSRIELEADTYLMRDRRWYRERYGAYWDVRDLVHEEAIIAGIESGRGYPCDDILSFIEIRLAEETLLARRCVESGGDAAARWVGPADEAWRGDLPRMELAARFDTARVLRAVDAKRDIIRLHITGDEADCATCIDRYDHEDENDLEGHPVPVIGVCPTLRALASEWSDHPDYRQEWRQKWQQ